MAQGQEYEALSDTQTLLSLFINPACYALCHMWLPYVIIY